MLVLIKRSARAFTVGEIGTDEISGLHWDNVSGGVNQRQGGFSLYGYIDYARAAELVDCSGMHGGCGRVAKIMVPASLNRDEPYREGYLELLDRVGYKRIGHYRYPEQKPCTKRILGVLKEHGPQTRKEIRDMLRQEKYPSVQIARALNRMEKDGRILYKQGSSKMPGQIIALNTY